MASTDANPQPKKNVAFRVTFPIYDNTGALVTGASGLDSEVSKDAGTFTDCTNEATEIATSSGIYYLDLTSTEMNADTVAVIVKTSTSDAKTTVLVFYPQELGDVKVDLDSILGTAVATPATAGLLDVNAIQFDGSAPVQTTGKLWTLDGSGNAIAPASAIPSASTIAAAVRDVDNSTPAAGSLGEAVRGADAKAADIQITLGTAGDGLTALATQASVDAIPTADENALALLKYDFDGITGEASHSPLNAMRSTRNDWSNTAAAGKRRVYKEDGTTTAFDQTLTTDPSAIPITGASD